MRWRKTQTELIISVFSRKKGKIDLQDYWRINLCYLITFFHLAKENDGVLSANVVLNISVIIFSIKILIETNILFLIDIESPNQNRFSIRKP